MTKQEFVSSVREHLNWYIKMADQKASILLTAQLAFLGLFANALGTLFPTSSVWFQAFAVLSAVSGLFGVFLAGWVVYPRTPKPEKGFVFWENIREYDSVEAYGESLHELGDEGIVDEEINENYELAQVAKQKYSYLRWSLRSTAAMVGLAVLSGMIYLA
jgi:hypothetical protein